MPHKRCSYDRSRPPFFFHSFVVLQCFPHRIPPARFPPPASPQQNMERQMSIGRAWDHLPVRNGTNGPQTSPWSPLEKSNEAETLHTRWFWTPFQNPLLWYLQCSSFPPPNPHQHPSNVSSPKNNVNGAPVADLDLQCADRLWSCSVSEQDTKFYLRVGNGVYPHPARTDTSSAD